MVCKKLQYPSGVIIKQHKGILYWLHNKARDYIVNYGNHIRGVVFMKHYEMEIPVLLEFRGMERPVKVSLPQPVQRYLDIYASREHTAEGSVIYKQGERARVLPVCLLPRKVNSILRP